jgi:signal peptidase II
MCISAWDIFPVVPRFLNIVQTANPGAASGALSDSCGPWRRSFLVAVSLAVMTVIGSLLWRPGKSGMSNSTLLQTGLALVFGGAWGNVWDRILYGTVTDFLQFFFGSYEFPSFNAADSAISVGAVLLLFDLWRKPPGSRLEIAS